MKVDWGNMRKVPRSQEVEEYINGPLHAIFLPAAVCSIRQAPILPLYKTSSTQNFQHLWICRPEEG